MTLEELEIAFKQVARLLQAEIAIRKNSDVYRTKLADWEQAKENLIRIKDELKRQIGEKEELKRELIQDALFPLPRITYH